MASEPWREEWRYSLDSTRCVGCGVRARVSKWGPWCFACNVPRMERLNKQFAALAATLPELEKRERNHD